MIIREALNILNNLEEDIDNSLFFVYYRSDKQYHVYYIGYSYNEAFFEYKIAASKALSVPSKLLKVSDPLYDSYSALCRVELSNEEYTELVKLCEGNGNIFGKELEQRYSNRIHILKKIIGGTINSALESYCINVLGKDVDGNTPDWINAQNTFEASNSFRNKVINYYVDHKL